MVDLLTTGGRIFILEKELGLRPILSCSWIIDNLGMTFSIDSLQSGSLMHYLRERYYGEGRLSRLWCQKIRPKVMRKKQERIADLYETALKIYQRDFLNAVMEVKKETENHG